LTSANALYQSWMTGSQEVVPVPVEVEVAVPA
jgi:hypothetical protein